MPKTITLTLTPDQLQALWCAVATDAENRREHFEGLEPYYHAPKEIKMFEEHLALIEGLEDTLDDMKMNGEF